MCYVKAIACSDESTENHHNSAVPLNATDIYGVFQLISLVSQPTTLLI